MDFVTEALLLLLLKSTYLWLSNREPRRKLCRKYVDSCVRNYIVRNLRRDLHRKPRRELDVPKLSVNSSWVDVQILRI